MIPPPPAPLTVKLTDDTGLSNSDHLTRDARLTVEGLAPGATWAFSLDDGQTWQAGSGTAIDAALFAQDGRHTVQVRQTNANGTSEPATFSFTLDTHADTLDLSSQTGPQTHVGHTIDGNAFLSGFALTATQDALTADSLHELRLQLGGAGFDRAQDRLLLDTWIELSTSSARDDINVAGIEGLSYRYDPTTARLTLWRADGEPMSGSDAAALTNAIRLGSPQAQPHDGERTVTLSMLDAAGNVSAASTVSMTVDSRRPVLDFNGTSPGVDTTSFSASLAAPALLLPGGSGLTHANPDASYQRVDIDLGGTAISRDDQLGILENGALTPFGGGQSTCSVAGTAWSVSQAGGHYTFARADGSPAGLAQTQALLNALGMQNTSATAAEGSRTFTIQVTDQLGRTASATSSLSLDKTAPVIDLNGLTPGLDHAITAVAGVPTSFMVGATSRIEVDEAAGIRKLIFTISSSVTGALDGRDFHAEERFGLAEPGDPTNYVRMSSMGRPDDYQMPIDRRGLNFMVTIEVDAQGTTTLTYEANMPMSADTVRQLMERLAYHCEAGAVPGERQVSISAEDVAGNVSTVLAHATIDVRPAGTPTVSLSAATDTGRFDDDTITSANGGASAPLTLEGFAPAGDVVTVFRDADGNGTLQANGVLGTVAADANGRWTLTLDQTTLADGVHRFGAVANGLTSGIQEITIDTTRPASVLSIGDTVSARPVLSGSTEANIDVAVEIDTDNNLANGYEVRYATRTDPLGHWRLDTATAQTAQGTSHRFESGDTVSVRVTATDRAGNATTQTVTSTTASAQYGISDSHVIEGTDGTREMVFMVTRSGDLSEAGSVRYAVDRAASSADDDASLSPSGDDFSGPTAGTLEFAAGETSKLVRFTVHGDHFREVNEKVAVRLDQAQGGQVDDGLGIGNINEIDVSRLQAAYGLRDLNPRSNDFAVRVRRASDNAEQDIGFDANGELDRKALLDFVGRGATDKGYVSRWYDQSGHGRDMTQADSSRQGVIVDSGAVIMRADGSVGISFNAGRNGSNNDFMTTNGVAASDWESVAIYAKVQSEGGANGSLFNLGDTAEGRLSSHYPEASGDRGYVFDVQETTVAGRLSRPLESGTSLTGKANDLVFEGHSGNTSMGDAALNYTDGAQVIYENGIRVVSDGTLPAQFSTSNQWKLAWHGAYRTSDSNYYQQAMYNEFLVYLAKDNSTPEIESLQGTAGNDVLTYAGEAGLKGIDGLAGRDVLYVSGGVDLDFAALSNGVKGIETVWMDNGAANTLTLTAATLATNGTGPLVVQMDAGDRVVLDGKTFAYSEDRTQTLVIGQKLSDVVVATARNDVLIGGEGADTFMWLNGQTGHDTVLDYNRAQGDQIDLTQLLRGFTEGDEARFIQRAIDAQGHTELRIDAHGNGDFAHAEMTITLVDVNASDAITVVTSPGHQAVL